MNRTKILALGVAILILSLSVLLILFFRSTEEPANFDGVTRVACMGDSNTEVTGYPADLQTKLGANYSVGNFGSTGATVLLDTDGPYLNRDAFKNATDFQPNIVVIMLGTNDARTNIYMSIDHFVDDYVKLIREVQQFKSKPKIWLATPPPIFDNNLSLSSEYLTDGVIPRIRRVATIVGLPLIDVYSTLATHSEYFSDGVHVNSAGAEIIASEVFKGISRSTYSR